MESFSNIPRDEVPESDFSNEGKQGMNPEIHAAELNEGNQQSRLLPNEELFRDIRGEEK